MRQVTIIGASHGLGAAITAIFHAQGDHVTAVARHAAGLEALAERYPGTTTVVGDATDPATAQALLRAQPDVVILAAGAATPNRPFHELDWQAFSQNWEGDTRMAFNLLKAGLTQPVKPAVVFVIISSGSAIGGSPISGGYGGAKRMQMFLAGYAQKEAQRAHRDTRFFALAPAEIMPQTEFGLAAAQAYGVYNGTTTQGFLSAANFALTPEQVAQAVLDMANRPDAFETPAWVLRSSGLTPM